MAFDISLISRMSDEIEDSGRRLRENVNSPNELRAEIGKLESTINSLKNLNMEVEKAGANANTAQQAPNQNQS